MTTEEQLAERAKADEWIASWNKMQSVAYDEEVKEREKRVRAKDDGAALPRAVEERLAKLDFDEHIRYRLPVGALLDTIEVDRDGDRRPSLYQLRQVAMSGVELFCAAIGHIDASEEFLEEARDMWGPLVDAALQEMNGSIQRRDPGDRRGQLSDETTKACALASGTRVRLAVEILTRELTQEELVRLVVAVLVNELVEARTEATGC